MKLIITNPSSDPVSYLNGLVSIEANSSLEVSSSNWVKLYEDLTFLTDIRNSNLAVSDGVTTYKYPYSEEYVKFILKDFNNRDSDGRLLSRPVAGKAGWKAQFHSIRISTSTENGVHNKNKAGEDLGFTTYTMKDANGDVTTNPAEAVQTVVTWEPTHDMEIIGGMLFQKTSPDQDVWMYVTAAAHIPTQYGGSIAFAEGGINLYDAPSGGHVDFDGRAAKYTTYDTVNHSGRFEILLKHPAGYVHKFSMIFELFKP